MGKSWMKEAGERMCANRLRIEERVYERRYVQCGRAGCWCASGSKDGKPGHGPYWYVCGADGGRWRKLYLGRELDTSAWRGEDGAIDWQAYDDNRRPGNVANVDEDGWDGSLEAQDTAAEESEAVPSTVKLTMRKNDSHPATVAKARIV